MSKYIANGEPWAIGTNVSDCKNSYEVMQKAGLDFVVDKCDLMARMPFGIKRNNVVNELAGEFSKDGHIFRELPGAYATYRADNSQPLGLVGDKYEVIQNVDAFRFFDDVVEDGEVKFTHAGLLDGGRRIYVSAKLPFGMNVNGDPIDNYLIFSNSHDGTSSVNIMFTPIRVWCTNKLNSAIKSADSYIKLKHTANIKKQLDNGAQILNAARQLCKTTQEFYESLTKIKMKDEDVMKYLADLQLTSKERDTLMEYDSKNGYKKLILKDYLTMERTGISPRKANKIATVLDYYFNGLGQKEIAGTAWGAFNAVTGYYANVANLEGEKRVQSLLYGGASNDIGKALEAVNNFAIAV